MRKINIAIDGPAGAGKSTVAKLVAERLHYVYVDTGAMYRALTWRALEEQVDVHNEQMLVQLLKRTRIQLLPQENGQHVQVDGRDITEEIRQRSVTNQVSFVASHQGVRQGMVHLQQDMAQDRGVVMDGRDIGTHVLPDAEVKIFLSASLPERARRRHTELQQKGEKQSLEEVEEEIRLRDQRDRGRIFAPLQKAKDAVELDTTGLSVDMVVSHILEIADTFVHSKGEPHP